MPVYEARFLIQAETLEAAREAIRVPNTPHTEPVLSQWGYHSQIDEDTAGVYESTLSTPGAKRQKGVNKNGAHRKSRGPLSEAHKAALQAGRAKALAVRRAKEEQRETI